MQCLQCVFYSLLHVSLQKQNVCATGHQNNLHTSKIILHRDWTPLVLKFPDPPLICKCPSIHLYAIQNIYINANLFICLKFFMFMILVIKSTHLYMYYSQIYYFLITFINVCYFKLEIPIWEISIWDKDMSISGNVHFFPSVEHISYTPFEN